MLTLASNKQSMKCSLQGERVPIYETDENGNIVYYTDSDGNKIPIETGEYTTGYSQPVSFFGNIAMSGGEVDSVEFGIDVSGYDATLVVDKGTMLLLRVQLIEYHDKYVELGEIPSYAYDNFVEMYNAYHALGGNGMITKMYDEIQALHLQKKDGGNSHE